MTSLWNELEGVYLAGEYGLDQCLGVEQNAAFYRTTFGPDQRTAVLKLMPDDPATAEEQLALWSERAALSHPHLLELLDFGRTETPSPLLYPVFQPPHHTL